MVTFCIGTVPEAHRRPYKKSSRYKIVWSLKLKRSIINIIID